MKKTITIAFLASLAAAAALALPGDLLVLADATTGPDEARGLYYLGGAAGRFLYNGSEEALAGVAPYAVLDHGARDKDYYVVWAHPAANLTPASFAHLGFAAWLGAEGEMLVGLTAGRTGDDIRAVDWRVEVTPLAPTPYAPASRGAETPPTVKDPQIEAAVNALTAREYASLIQKLQDSATRYTGTPGYMQARDNLKQFFEDLGCSVTLFPFNYGGGNTAENVVAERLGSTSPSEIIIVCGHMDSASESPVTSAPGAEDNASGTAVAMAAAHVFEGFSFGRTVRFIGFGGEEQGLLGSHAYADFCRSQNQNIVAVLNADMIAYDEENGARDDTSIAYGTQSWLLDYLAAVDNLYANHITYDHVEFSGSDHVYFWNNGYAALGAIEGEVGTGGILDYPYYHTTRDTVDRLQPAFAVRVVRDFCAMFAHLAKAQFSGIEDPPFAPGPATPRARPLSVYPNPYHYASGGGVTFANVAAPATITVYDLAGRKIGGAAVAAGREEYSWAPRAADGSRLVPGLYLYRVKGTAQEETGKLVVTE